MALPAAFPALVPGASVTWMDVVGKSKKYEEYISLMREGSTVSPSPQDLVRELLEHTAASNRGSRAPLYRDKIMSSAAGQIVRKSHMLVNDLEHCVPLHFQRRILESACEVEDSSEESENDSDMQKLILHRWIVRAVLRGVPGIHIAKSEEEGTNGKEAGEGSSQSAEGSGKDRSFFGYGNSGGAPMLEPDIDDTLGAVSQPSRGVIAVDVDENAEIEDLDHDGLVFQMTTEPTPSPSPAPQPSVELNGSGNDVWKVAESESIEFLEKWIRDQRSRLESSPKTQNSEWFPNNWDPSVDSELLLLSPQLCYQVCTEVGELCMLRGHTELGEDILEFAWSLTEHFDPIASAWLCTTPFDKVRGMLLVCHRVVHGPKSFAESEAKTNVLARCEHLRREGQANQVYDLLLSEVARHCLHEENVLSWAYRRSLELEAGKGFSLPDRVRIACCNAALAAAVGKRLEDISFPMLEGHVDMLVFVCADVLKSVVASGVDVDAVKCQLRRLVRMIVAQTRCPTQLIRDALNTRGWLADLACITGSNEDGVGGETGTKKRCVNTERTTATNNDASQPLDVLLRKVTNTQDATTVASAILEMCEGSGQTPDIVTQWHDQLVGRGRLLLASQEHLAALPLFHTARSLQATSFAAHSGVVACVVAHARHVAEMGEVVQESATLGESVLLSLLGDISADREIDSSSMRDKALNRTVHLFQEFLSGLGVPPVSILVDLFGVLISARRWSDVLHCSTSLSQVLGVRHPTGAASPSTVGTVIPHQESNDARVNVVRALGVCMGALAGFVLATLGASTSSSGIEAPIGSLDASGEHAAPMSRDPRLASISMSTKETLEMQLERRHEIQEVREQWFDTLLDSLVALDVPWEGKNGVLRRVHDSWLLHLLVASLAKALRRHHRVAARGSGTTEIAANRYQPVLWPEDVALGDTRAEVLSARSTPVSSSWSVAGSHRSDAVVPLIKKSDFVSERNVGALTAVLEGILSHLTFLEPSRPDGAWWLGLGDACFDRGQYLQTAVHYIRSGVAASAAYTSARAPRAPRLDSLAMARLPTCLWKSGLAWGPSAAIAACQLRATGEDGSDRLNAASEILKAHKTLDVMWMDCLWDIQLLEVVAGHALRNDDQPVLSAVLQQIRCSRLNAFNPSSVRLRAVEDNIRAFLRRLYLVLVPCLSV